MYRLYLSWNISLSTFSPFVSSLLFMYLISEANLNTNTIDSCPGMLEKSWRVSYYRSTEVLKVCCTKPQEILLGSHPSQNYFHSKNHMPFAYVTVFIFVGRVDKTWISLTTKPGFLILALAIIKAVTPKCGLVVILSFTNSHWKQSKTKEDKQASKRKQCQFHLTMSFTKQ